MTHLATIIIRRFNSAALFCSSIGVLLLISCAAQATEWVILPTVQNGDPGTMATDPNGPTLGMVLWSTVGTNGGGSQKIYGQGTGPGYACYGLVNPTASCVDDGQTEIWIAQPVTYLGTVNDDPMNPTLNLSWTGQAGTKVPFGMVSLFTSSILSGSYNAAGEVTGTDPGIAGYDMDGFSCWNDPLTPLPGPPDFCGNGTGNPFTVPASGQTIANRALPGGLQPIMDNLDGTITIDLIDTTYTDCVADAACNPGSNSSDVFAQWTVNAEFSGITVGNYIGLTVDEATQEINDAGLTVSTTRRFSDTVVPGTVMFQNPPEGTRAQRGGLVDLTVASNIVIEFPGGTAMDPWSLLLLLGLPLLRRRIRRTKP